LKDEKAKERDALLLASQLNQAMCYLKLEDFKNAREMSDKALELDPKNDKGLFRKGQV
jgi:FK506-binding protein 4/5